MWGQAVFTTLLRVRIRIIPTRVGTREDLAKAYEHGKDHPHACGDKWHSFEFTEDNAGSSPRVWGQGLKNLAGVDFERIIPTRVGTR